MKISGSRALPRSRRVESLQKQRIEDNNNKRKQEKNLVQREECGRGGGGSGERSPTERIESARDGLMMRRRMRDGSPVQKI